LNIRHSPENLRNPAQSGTSTTRSKAQGVHIVHTLILARFRHPNPQAQAAVRAGRLRLARGSALIGRADLRKPAGRKQPSRSGAAPMLEIDEHHGGGFLLSEHFIEKKTATCMT
jgi:hypothetical protein